MKEFSPKNTLFSNLKKHKDILLFIILFTFIYFLFFKNIFNGKFNFWNSDAEIKMYPSQVYLNEKLTNFELPLWTERVFLGYPIYEDMELGYLNPINLLGNIFLGEVNNLKFLHFASYLVGAICFYLLFKSNSNSFLKVLGSILIFYFSFFPINRLIHLNLLLTFLTIPIVLYLAEKLNSLKKLKYLILLGAVLAYGILWGHLQTVILIFIILFLFNLNQLGLKKAIVYSILSSIFALSFSFHQLYPSFHAFLGSSRTSTEIKYSDFSNFPGFELNNLFPFLLGYYQNYQGIEISGAMSYVETYNYIGIVSFIVLIIYLIYGSSDRYYPFVRNLLIIYIILSFKDFFPIVKDFSIPLYDNFRYWGRSVVLVILATTFSIKFVLSEKFNFSKPNFRFISLVSVFYIISTLSGVFITRDSNFNSFWSFLFSNQFVYLKKIEFLIWLFLICITGLFIFFRHKKRMNIALIILISSILFDYLYFTEDLIPNRISRYNSFLSIKTPDECINRRCLLENTEIDGYESLMYKTFGPYGYSQFLSQEYKDFYIDTFKGDYRKSYRSTIIREELNIKTLENLGFTGIFLADSGFVPLEASQSFINSEIKVIKSEESSHKIEAYISEPKYLKLNLKYTPNWLVWVNGKEVRLEKDVIFSKIMLTESNNQIEISYFPFDILYGAIIGIFLFILGVLMVGPNGLEPLTSSLSEKRSNHLSYDPYTQSNFTIITQKL